MSAAGLGRERANGHARLPRTMSAGGIHHVFGWRAVNLGVTPLLGAIALAVLWLALDRRRSAVVPV